VIVTLAESRLEKADRACEELEVERKKLKREVGQVRSQVANLSSQVSSLEQKLQEERVKAAELGKEKQDNEILKEEIESLKKVFHLLLSQSKFLSWQGTQQSSMTNLQRAGER
jgi:predicted RNase H-like nuclease (RuvC/YqgF family)